jgi:hypothetical protein
MYGINGMVNGMVFGWLVVYYEIECEEDGSDVQ